MRGLIAAIVVVVLIGGVLVFGRSSATTPATESKATGLAVKPTTDAGTDTSAALLPVKVVLEAEETTTISDKTADGKTEVLHIHEISDGATVKYLEVDNGFIDRCKLGADKEEAGKLPGRASYEFEVPRKDTYYVHLRAKWRDNCGNSAWVGIDDDKWHNLEDQEGKVGEKNYAWAWHPLWVGGAPKGFELAAGKHILWFNVREDGPKLDQWLITTEAQKPVGVNPLKK